MNARTSNLPDNSETAGFQHMSNIQLEDEGVLRKDKTVIRKQITMGKV